MTINVFIRRQRIAAGLTQQALAKAVGRSAGTVQKWERCNSRVCVNLLPALASALGTDVEKLQTLTGITRAYMTSRAWQPAYCTTTHSAVNARHGTPRQSGKGFGFSAGAAQRGHARSGVTGAPRLGGRVRVGKPSRDKGARGEREWAAYCRAQGYDASRTAQHMGKGGGQPDVTGLPGVHLEIKRTEALRLYDAVDQAKRDAKPGLLRAVPHRKNHCEWVVIMPADDWFAMYREWEAGRAIRDEKPIGLTTMEAT